MLGEVVLAGKTRKKQVGRINAPEAAVLSTQQQLAGKVTIANVIEDDPEEVLVPLIVNKLANDG